MNYGLTTQTIQTIQAVFAQYPAVERVTIYGSRAMGNYRAGSDIDLVLHGPALTLTDLQAIELQLDDLLLPYKIDLALHKQIDNQNLLHHIDRVGKLFYNKEEI